MDTSLADEEGQIVYGGETAESPGYLMNTNCGCGHTLIEPPKKEERQCFT